MSFALLLFGSISCLLVLGLLASFWWLARVERRHEEATGIRTEDRPTRAGTSGDLHLFLGLPAALVSDMDAFVALAGKDGAIEVDRVGDAVARFEALFAEASHAHAEFGHFRLIDARADASVAAIAYFRVRTRRPIITIVDRSRRAEWVRVFDGLRSLTAADAIELEAIRVTSSTDKAVTKLAKLD